MGRVEYREINQKFDQPRRVLLTPGVYNRSFQALAIFNPTDPQSVESTKTFLAADYETILDKFHSALPTRDTVHPIIGISLNVDEQKYISYAFKSFADSLYEKNELSLCRNLYMFRDRFLKRCWIANRQISLPPNMLKLGARVTIIPQPGNTE